jgi:hypothetical protein
MDKDMGVAVVTAPIDPAQAPDAWAIEALHDQIGRLENRNAYLVEVLDSIRRFGEMANVSAQPPHSFVGGKKPASKDVWQFPRHLLEDIDTAIGKAEDQP